MATTTVEETERQKLENFQVLRSMIPLHVPSVTLQRNRLDSSIINKLMFLKRNRKHVDRFGHNVQITKSEIRSHVNKKITVYEKKMMR
ncbi:hypothetical protein RIR_jg31529.t1 [Rhizophagus irregularis DAOM 181602=DAOM 197198]|nr:hypothetical protein RIR_jg31529.t1 [Rhizophagus irregularis DAOM 181602=DAOM 197198]